jgi:hypothetical protein
MEQSNFPKVPEMIHDTTGGEINIEEIRDKFYGDVINFVGFNDEAVSIFVNRKCQSICDSVPGGMSRETDDRFDSLWMRDYLVAFTIEYRTPLNWVNVIFNHNFEKIPGLLSKLRADPILLTAEVRKQLENS